MKCPIFELWHMLKEAASQEMGIQYLSDEAKTMLS